MASWLPRTQVSGQRLSVSATTTPLLPGASALLDLPGLGRLGHFLAVSTDAPGWVSFYSSAAAREADGSRHALHVYAFGGAPKAAAWLASIAANREAH